MPLCPRSDPEGSLKEAASQGRGVLGNWPGRVSGSRMGQRAQHELTLLLIIARLEERHSTPQFTKTFHQNQLTGPRRKPWVRQARNPHPAPQMKSRREVQGRWWVLLKPTQMDQSPPGRTQIASLRIPTLNRDSGSLRTWPSRLQLKISISFYSEPMEQTRLVLAAPVTLPPKEITDIFISCNSCCRNVKILFTLISTSKL